MVVHNQEVYSRMFLWCIDGCGNVTVNGKQYRFTKGSFLIIPWKHEIKYKADPVTPFNVAGVHLIPWYDPDLPYSAKVAHKHDAIWWEGDSLRDIEIPGMETIVSGHFTRETVWLENLSFQAIELFHGQRLTRTTARAIATLLWEELLLLTERSPQPMNDREAARFERIVGFIRENLNEEISIEILCDIGAVSRSTLRRIFKKLTSKSPYSWILDARLERARYLLRTTTVSVAQISQQTGFQDPSYFIRIFGKREGIPPRQYRMKVGKI
jgi:AraC family transcriptional regulator, arabinose operon regulatory protein